MSAGQRLRQRIQAELDESGLVLDGREEELLDRAVMAADLVEELEAVIAEKGVTTKGTRGLIVSPAVTEIRHQNTLIKSLLAGINFDPPTPADSKSQRGRKAAHARWAGGRGNGTG